MIILRTIKNVAFYEVNPLLALAVITISTGTIALALLA